MRRFSSVFAALIIALAAVSCVKVNEQVGSNFIPSIDGVTVYQLSLPLDFIEQRQVDSLSCISETRLTMGAMKSENYGVTKRSSAVTLYPLADSINVGLNPRNARMKFSVARDTLNCMSTEDESIIQTINVYELPKRLDSLFVTTRDYSDSDFDGSPIITKAHPVYFGQDSLAFEFSEEFAAKYVNAFKANSKLFLKEKDYFEAFPGIYFSVSEPLALGGRINIFDFNLSYDSSGYVQGNYVSLSFRSDYKRADGTIRENVDTSFVFCIGNLARPTKKSEIAGYAYNFTHSENNVTPDGEFVYVEGGDGLKPVISSKMLKESFLEAVADTLGKVGKDLDIKKIIINRATLVMPYEYDSDVWEKYSRYPYILSPTVRVPYHVDSTKVLVAYAGITDTSISTESVGRMDRSNLEYAPDITHHFQSIINTPVTGDESAFYEARDIWMFVVAPARLRTQNSDTNYNDYYNAMLYSQYYNNMYNGYGYGMGGYGYGGYGYNNYYNYAMMNAMMNSSSTPEVQYQNSIDITRYYDCKLYGPQASDASKRPYMFVTFCVTER